MAMTVRLTEDQNNVLEAIAKAEGVSKQEAVVRAIAEKAARMGKDERIRALTREVIRDDGPLLDRLAR